MTPSLRMGEMAVARDGVELRTLLGSCVGVALFDRTQSLGGLAHIVLPDSRGDAKPPGKFADTAVPELIRQIEEQAIGRPKLVAKIAGGASMFSNTLAAAIGEQNIEVCEGLLADRRIPILARHCGGSQGRKMRLNTLSGEVIIEIVGQQPIRL